MKKFTLFTTKCVLSFLLVILLLGYFFPFSSFAASEEMLYEMELRKELPVQSNEFINWPIGPEIGAEGAILIEANSNTILYSKNANEKLYPASTTKILTAILIMEHCELDEVITFSEEAINSISWNDSNMGASIGDQITVEQALYAILIGSANEVAYAMAEYIGGDLDSFVALMNEKAKELGCINSHFSNPSGLHDDTHYTTAYDLSLIAKEFFKYDFLCNLSRTYSHEVTFINSEQEPTFIYSKNKLFSNREYSYENLIGSKTGYTDAARQTLVSCAQKDGMSLICVVLKEETPYQFEDTVSLFNYGFSNFNNLYVSDHETDYTFSFSDTFQCDYSIFGDSTPLISFDPSYYVTLPLTANFSDLTKKIDLTFDSSIYDNASNSNTLAYINYYYFDSMVGFFPIHFQNQNDKTEPSLYESEILSPSSNIHYIQLKKIFLFLLLIFTPLISIAYIKAIFFHSSISKRKSKRRQRKKSHSPYKSIKF